MIPRRIAEISAFARQTSKFPCHTALVVQVAILNLHPLSDGNGRVSRIAANILMRCGYEGLRTFLPVYELRHHAPYAFEIALRSAEIHGEWTRLAGFHEGFIKNILSIHV